MPPFSSEQTRSTCSRRVSDAFTDITQQIHSLRASGVRVSQVAKAFGSDRRALRRSSGRSCATPAEIVLGIRFVPLHHEANRSGIARLEYAGSMIPFRYSLLFVAPALLALAAGWQPPAADELLVYFGTYTGAKSKESTSRGSMSRQGRSRRRNSRRRRRTPASSPFARRATISTSSTRSTHSTASRQDR